jgi:hypothetical protein
MAKVKKSATEKNVEYILNLQDKKGDGRVIRGGRGTRGWRDGGMENKMRNPAEEKERTNPKYNQISSHDLTSLESHHLAVHQNGRPHAILPALLLSVKAQ